MPTTTIYGEFGEVINTVSYLPCVSIIMPFEPKMGKKAEIETRLKSAIDAVKKDLARNYPDDKAVPVLHKLYGMIKQLNYNTHKKSIAIFVSPLIEKVYYLDIPVEEKVIIDESFEIRDLVYSKKDIHKYLVLVLSSKRSTIYLGNTTQFIRIVSNRPEHAAAFKNDIAEPVANFSDPSRRKEQLMDKFLRHTDNGLALILQSYALPLFVMGTDRTIGHFKKMSKHCNRINGYIHGNFEESTEAEIREALAPYIADWKGVIQEDILRRLDAEDGRQKLSTGIEQVWQTAAGKKGRLLVIEKNYMHPMHRESHAKINETGYNDSPFYIKDAVDDIVEKVLENGGDVEFVDEGLLKRYNHIALVQYY